MTRGRGETATGAGPESRAQGPRARRALISVSRLEVFEGGADD